ncbi:MAG: hypothetical protein Q9182_006277 [Xanthomendoza sp. 2 TL-2023]
MLKILPPEIVSHILDCVMHSETPFDISLIFMNQSCKAIPTDQSSHIKDWKVATAVCHDFNTHGQRSFFTQKILTVPPDLLGQYPTASGTAPLDTTPWLETRDRFLANARQVIAPIPACSAASAFMTLPRYQPRFMNLRCLIIWPGTRIWPRTGSFETVPAPDSAEHQREPAHRELLDLLRGVGAEVDRVEINIVHSRDEQLRRSENDRLRQSVYPYLRMVGSERVKRIVDWTIE